MESPAFVGLFLFSRIFKATFICILHLLGISNQTMKKLYVFAAAFFAFNLANAQIINFPDANFKSKLVLSSPTNFVAHDLSGNVIAVDANHNGEIEMIEAAQVGSLDLKFSSISSLEGINYFANLKSLGCDNNLLTSLNIDGLQSLEHLWCDDNMLTSLDLSPLSNLQGVFCFDNDLTSLTFGYHPNMIVISAYTNHLSTIDLSGLPNLIELTCFNNNLTSINPAGLQYLKELNVDFNQLGSLNISGLTSMEILRCSNNQLTTIDLHGLDALKVVWCHSNQLTMLDVSEQVNIQSVSCTENPMTHYYTKNGNTEQPGLNYDTMQYICADDDELVYFASYFDFNNITTCEVNTYCSFMPGGAFFTLAGVTHYDEDNNGCGNADFLFPGLKLAISNGIDSGTYIANGLGNYAVPLQEGVYTVTPQIENPAYFSISPPTVPVNFPTQASPLLQDFCLAANGIHNDLGISIVPLTAARPGFNADYKIIYTNKGTETQSGFVSLSFDNAVLNFVSASPNVSSLAPNTLQWNFMNLAPFESWEIQFTLDVHSATDTPGINSGDILNYTAAISGLADETPADNSSQLNQTVVNSLDPNDKICLEGNTISPDMIGQYVHYVIRFENTGTANAENIVVKDMIDTSKFDINTLIPLTGSHPFTTKISSANKVEFIFENINLPFDDANNDGYVAFKIKTKPTLVVGDTFSNTANIYFDYNFQIVTNTATTAIQLLGNPDFEFSEYFALYPNPAKNMLNIQSKNGVEVKSIAVYNMLGQLVQAVTNMENTSSIDVSQLKAGNYFIKVNSVNGNAASKFSKE
jgi:Leucine-rich repeat (LRR) protein